MCNGFYLAASKAPPLVEWYEGAAFSVAPLRENEAGLRGCFSLPHVVRLGAYSGCSCGFGYSETAGADEKASSRASQSALIAYLAEAAAASGHVELYMTWWPGDTRPPERTLHWELEALRKAGTFDMEEGDFAIVSRDERPLTQANDD
ncbi:MAG: hypothetical protein H6725_20555 [Sandaracinaceae bacterium]|nr:hypothetical protein [Sandaracinaceae bacterium]